MDWLNDWARNGWRLALLPALLFSVAASAQAPAGDGLLGEYYNGTTLSEFVLSRRDATVSFDWARRPRA